METITIKIYKITHDKLKAAHIADVGKRKEITSFIQFCDNVIISGLNDSAELKRLSGSAARMERAK